jgi:hypothetical protein
LRLVRARGARGGADGPGKCSKAARRHGLARHGTAVEWRVGSYRSSTTLLCWYPGAWSKLISCADKNDCAYVMLALPLHWMCKYCHISSKGVVVCNILKAPAMQRSHQKCCGRLCGDAYSGVRGVGAVVDLRFGRVCKQHVELVCESTQSRCKRCAESGVLLLQPPHTTRCNLAASLTCYAETETASCRNSTYRTLTRATCCAFERVHCCCAIRPSRTVNLHQQHIKRATQMFVTFALA